VSAVSAVSAVSDVSDVSDVSVVCGEGAHKHQPRLNSIPFTRSYGKAT
jgi:hypothetical protein